MTNGPGEPGHRLDSFDRYWGKAAADHLSPRPGKQGLAYHLMGHHSLDVAAVVQVLLQRVVPLRLQLARLLDVDEHCTVKLACFFASLHDLGKVDWRFAMKARAVGIALDPARAACPATSGYDHGAAGFAYVCRAGRERQALLACLDEGWLPLLRAAAGHHGTLPSPQCDSVDLHAMQVAESALLRAMEETDGQARADFITALADLFALSPESAPRPTLRSNAVWFFAGLVAVADWIGSNTDFFGYHPDPRPLADYYEQEALPAAERALTRLGWFQTQPSGAGFADLFAFTPRGLQKVAVELDLPPGSHLVIVEAPPGEGKTETALALASRFLARHEAAGLYFALPTMATANGLFGRVLDSIPKLFQGEGEVNTLLLHGRADSNQQYRTLVQHAQARSYQDEPLPRHDADRPAEATAGQWFLEGRKRKLLAEVGVGTIDQVLQAVLRLKHGFVRIFGVGKDVVVVDEVHAYDVYMEVLLERLVRWLGALHAPVILLSATLPTARKQRLASAYREGLAAPQPVAPKAASLLRSARTASQRAASEARAPKLDAVAYPLLTVVGAKHEQQLAPRETAPADKCITIRILASDDAVASVVDELVRAARAGAAVCWIRNTVKDAQEAFRAVQEHLGDAAMLLHARFTGTHRTEREDEVLEVFGKRAATERRAGRVLIATQVVEQSLDLDFDFLVSDLAPIDLLMQRSGRLHRHARPTRPAGHEAPTMLVVTPSAEAVENVSFGASAHVYDPVTLELTRDSLAGLQGPLKIPSDVRPLIEAIYDPPTRATRIDTSPRAAKLLAAERELEAEIARRRQAAEQLCIPDPHSNASASEVYADSEELVQALTRDGDSATLLLVVFDPSTGELSTTDNATPLTLDADPAESFATLSRLLDQTIGVAKYPWEYPVEANDPAGEVAEWEAAESSLLSLLARFNRRDLVLVPLVRRGARFVGAYRTSRQRRADVEYDDRVGLVVRFQF